MRSSLVLGVSRLILLVPLLSSTASAADNRTCYMVDEKTVAIDDVPCSTKETTHCCNKNDICMSNGLCWVQSTGDMVLSRGSCTDINWGGDCVAARPCARANPTSGYPVVNADIANHQFCCGSVVSSSSSDGIKCSGDGPFPVPTGTVIPGVAALASVASTSSPSSSATHPAGNSNDTSSGNDTSSEKPEKSDDQSTKLAIGLGLGLPLGIIAGSALMWGAWERKKSVSARREMDQLKATMAYQYAPVPQMQAAPPVEMGHNEYRVAELPPGAYNK
ncbi:hypothetical protein F9C07_1925775 [Aspergillus flavus]|uniref:Mid2 domain-containing protein n=2 Tax=Aspergillus flavus TaxID=5059 RepID=A0A7U2MZ21_ASPFN|nr:uncharacterized protein G4B84_011987 [Aspergillus flavus NRRL3357]QRD92514.1 hypothetical protein F9C07_1925775 [Aspergillus flavus]KAF7626508.1 hypothetical protein AFLA_013899 [Aspergillus flavus NRRL3357]QMW36458.1 hypothetical protein G4B84_011987 [Aspergillus flavus NRRL3357]RMZ44112.1 hypothetical protein CA14_004158 [Aspergillus flavus]UDD65737.1 hypothetical protein AFCA_012910 [Aspergillus flavus]